MRTAGMSGERVGTVMGFYQKLLQSVSPRALFARPAHGREPGFPLASRFDKRHPARSDRLARTPLIFETMEPRILLSGDPLTLAAQQALVAGLQSFEAWTASQLTQAAQLAQLLPVVSTSVGDLVDLPSQIQTHLVQPIQTYFAANGSTSTVEGLAAALAADPADAGGVVGQFAHGEFLVTLSAFQSSEPITTPLNLSEDSAGASLQIASPPLLSGQTTVSMALTFGFDTGTGNTPNTTPTFFIQPGTIVEGVTLAATGFNTAATVGAADATVTAGSANLTATAMVALTDPLPGDPNNYITPAELTGTAASLVSTTLSGTANVSLPIASSLVPGGPQTLQLDWSGNLSASGSSNLASLGSWASLDTISPSLVREAVAALPGMFQALGSAGFNASIPVLGQDLGEFFNFGAEFSNAANAVATTASLNQVAAALQQQLGTAVTFSVDTADNELDMLVTASNPFEQPAAWSIDQPVGDVSLVLNGGMQVTGTAAATLDLALSFDTSLPDSDRIQLVENGSLLGLAFDAATPITAAAMLGPASVQVTNGSLTIGSGGVNPSQPATATVNFLNTGSGRMTLAQLAANPSAALSAPVFTGAIQATLPLTGAPVGITWDLSDPSNPVVTGADELVAAPVAVAVTTQSTPALTSTQLSASSAAALQAIDQATNAISTAAGETGAMSTPVSLFSENLTQLSQMPTILGAVASAIQSYAVSGASTTGFINAMNTAFAAFDAANPGFTITVNQTASYAGFIPAADASEAAGLGLTTGSDQLVFNLTLTANYAGTQTFALTGGKANNNVSFSASVPYASTVLLGLTFGVTLTPNLAPADATFVLLNQLAVGVGMNGENNFAANVGVLAAQIANGTISLTAQASAVLANNPGEAQTISEIAGTNAANLLTVTPEESSLFATLPVSSNFGGANSTITG